MKNPKLLKKIPKAHKDLILAIDRMIAEKHGFKESFRAMLNYGFKEYKNKDLQIEYFEIFTECEVIT